MRSYCKICGKEFEGENNRKFCAVCVDLIRVKREKAKEKHERTEHCIICGAKIEIPRFNNFTCSDECSSLLNSVYQINRRRRRRKKNAKIGQSNLDQRVKEANESGLTYGYYMAMKRGQGND